TDSAPFWPSFERITRPWQRTVLFFCPEISSGISKTISISVLSGNRWGPCRSTPDWLKFSITPSYQLPKFLTRWRTGVCSLSRLALGTHVGFLACDRPRRLVVVGSGTVCTRSLRRMVDQSYLYSAAQTRQTW